MLLYIMEKIFFANLSMRARVIALLLLIILIGVPICLYWIFFQKNTASLLIQTTSDIPYTVSLKGVLDSNFFPLINRLVSYEKECSSNCVIESIIPIEYELSIKSPWKLDFEDSLILWKNESRKLLYTPIGDVQILAYTWVFNDSENESRKLIDHAQSNTPWFSYKYIWVGLDGQVFAERNSLGRRELWIITLSSFQPIWKIPDEVWVIWLDLTHSFFVTQIGFKTFVFSPDLKIKKEFPNMNIYGYSWRGDEKILTDSWVFLVKDVSFEQNARFTDWIDWGSRYRIWYIDKIDTHKLELSDYPLWQSILLLFDRDTNTTRILRTWIHIKFLFYIGDTPAFVDGDNALWIVRML